MKTKSTKRALLMSALALLMCVSMLVGSTFAWFTDSVTSGRNVIMSGNLDVKLEYSVLGETGWSNYEEVTSTTDIFGYNLWEPGYVKVAKFKVTNVGSLALKYQLTADVYEEIAGVNVAGEKFYLSDSLYTEVVDTTATREAILASTTGKRLKAPVNGAVNNDLIVGTKALEPNTSAEVALAIWMPTTVGNEANHNGIDKPSITFGINLIATQQTSEKDSFDNQYDKDATYPIIAWGSKEVGNAANYLIDLLLANGAKVGSMDVPAAAVASTAKAVTVKVVETKLDTNVTVADDQSAKTFDITVDGLVAGNTAPIKVTLDVGAGLTGVKLYHNTTEITPVLYNKTTGQVTFNTTSFSPYTVLFDAVAVDEEVGGGTEGTTPVVPKATVTDANDFENVAISWTGWGGYNPTAGAAQQLNSVYLFESPHTSEEVDTCYYKDWYCDYYVKLESEKLTVLPEGSITLGGNYGGYGWVGFDNPEVNANEYIPLLGSVMPNNGWTYEAVCDFVQQFWCGVGVANGNTADLSDATFVVELRLTNPENADEYIVCNKVTYNFATGTSTFVDIVYSAEELFSAIMNGSTNVELGTNIDLNQSVVVPGTGN